MSEGAETGSGDGFTIDNQQNSIRLVRQIREPASAIFDAWTQPGQVSLWWDPTGKPLRECEIDPRIGGSFKFVSSDHPEMPFSGVYSNIDRPTLLEFDAMGAKGRVSIETANSITRMIVEIKCTSADHLKQYLKMGIASGTARTLDNLVKFASSRS